VSDEKTKSPNELTKNWNIKINPSVAKWLGWGFCTLVVLATLWGIGDGLLHSTDQVTLIQKLNLVLFSLFPLTFAVLAALVIIRQPGSSIEENQHNHPSGPVSGLQIHGELRDVIDGYAGIHTDLDCNILHYSVSNSAEGVSQ